MRGIFLKIFAIFWLAQSLIFIISTAFILSHHRPSPAIVFDTVFSGLRNEAKETAAAFEAGGCAAFEAYGAAHGQNLALEDPSGRHLCGAVIPMTARPDPEQANQIFGHQEGQQYVWRVPVTSARGSGYVLLLSRPYVPEHHTWYHDLWHFAFPQLPVAIAVGGLTTYVLVLLFTRPLVRLREAARALAEGNLKTRVAAPAHPSRIMQEDEFKALVRDFNHMADRLESLVGAQQLLLRDVSHELRSPLARLSVALELAREDAAPEMAAHLNRIERETEKLNQLIGQLLTLSSLEIIENTNQFRPVSLKGLIEEMIPDAEYEAQQRQSSVAFRADDECVIAGSRDLLYRAIENVVRNAVRYTEAGTQVEIHLRAATEEADPSATVEISDRGPGIPEEEINHIFRPFYRVDRARSTETGGFGVGLAITERAVKLHHGTLLASNRRDGGVTIRISLPLLQEHTVRPHEERAAVR